jgi:hypothetical protein
MAQDPNFKSKDHHLLFKNNAKDPEVGFHRIITPVLLRVMMEWVSSTTQFNTDSLHTTGPDFVDALSHVTRLRRLQF